ncbi:MAG: ATP-binding protein [Gulosibacter sp.]|uniref:ATP-binding protein n=1 Tax=Gulosibacter sp. TaxID=2817531 RepID=UPI003F92DE66
MEFMNVSVEAAHLDTLAKSPKTALAELIWNSIDADATTISIDLHSGAIGGLERLTVTDNGTGISPDDRESTFGALGNGWKRAVKQSPNGRPFHGERGSGRWAALGIGNSVRWTSIADSTADGRVRFTISVNKSNPKQFAISSATPASADDTGVTVEVTDLSSAGSRYLESASAKEDVLTTFALQIEQYGLTVDWQGSPLSVNALKRRQTDLPIKVEGIDDAVVLTIIEWKTPVARHLYLCDAAGNSLHDMKPGIQAPGFDFTAYLKWSGFEREPNFLGLEGSESEQVRSVVTAAQDKLREYFKAQDDERSARLIQQWQDEDSYPFRTPPTSRADEAARGLFDLVAVAAAPAVKDSDLKSRKLSLELLKNAVETSPSSVHHILEAVLDLPKEQADELSTLIQKTSLDALLRVGNQVVGRLEFLTGLEEIVNDKSLKKSVTERKQLHRVLAEETWVFREEYALTADDNTLRTALKNHIEELGRAELTPEDLGNPVLDADGREVVVDMMLSRVIEQSRNHREHIVIELKRPSIPIGKREMEQIENYAQAVASDGRFASTGVNWEFWIVGDEIKDDVLHKFGQGNLPDDVFSDFEISGHRVTVRGVTWARIIQDARHRMKFVKDALGYDPTSEQSMVYLRAQHGERLPTIALPHVDQRQPLEAHSASQL